MGRGCSDKGSKLLFEDHCETFQSKAKVHKLLLSKWRGDRESRWFWVLIAPAADWDCSSFRCSWHWVKERDLLYYPFPLYFSFSKGIDGFGQEGLYKHFFRLSKTGISPLIFILHKTLKKYFYHKILHTSIKTLKESNYARFRRRIIATAHIIFVITPW